MCVYFSTMLVLCLGNVINLLFTEIILLVSGQYSFRHYEFREATLIIICIYYIYILIL